MSRQQERAKARDAKKASLRGVPQPPTMKVPILGQKPTVHDFAKSIDELELLGDLVLIREISQEKTEGGILLPDGSREEGPRKGEVVLVGPGAMREDGTYMPMQVAPGQLVYLTLGARSLVMHIAGQPYHLVPDSAIMVKVRKSSQDAVAAAKDGSHIVME